MAKKSILFVDDDSNVLSGLRRMLRTIKDDWDMSFALGGKEALELFENQQFNVVVTDMRMPEIDGAELLTIIKNRYPQVVRIVLSGQAEEDSVIRALSVAHQYVSKPCNAEKLKSRVQKACFTGDSLAKFEIKEKISKTNLLSSSYRNYQSIISELSKTNPSIDKISDIILCDVAMSARCLQITNSSFFGHDQDILDIKKAVKMIGVERIRLLIEKTTVFNHIEVDSKLFSVELFNIESSLAAKEAIKISKNENAYTAALLTNIGNLSIVISAPEYYQKVLELIKNGTSPETAELQVYGASHQDIGHYILSLWGIPDYGVVS